ncbi:MAG: protoporphyrinogen oxidase [Rhodobacteraceae bacterium]|nr:MAG: protoporphyrinogen oxidase [Paracoccaceae bacterium]
MEIVVLFGTVEGQTRKIVNAVAEQARALGHGVTMIDTSDKRAEVSLSDADCVILAAPVHERRHPAAFEATLTAVRTALTSRPSLMLSVSLKAAFADGLEEAQDYLTEMQMRTGFQPTQQALVAGAVRPGSYDYYQSQVVRHVAMAGHEVDLDQGMREFTDWRALARVVAAFLNR